MLHSNLGINEKGHLTFAGFDTVELAGKYGTPCYFMDEMRIRNTCRTYKKALSEFITPASHPVYASKAASFMQMYRIMADEEMCADAVSSGELFTALKAGFNPKNLFCHGNNKTDADIKYAVDSGVGCIVVDSHEELEALNRYCLENGRLQKIYLRITPGIDPHTHKKIITGNVDSKFGTPIVTGGAMKLVKAALECRGVSLCGLHCHVGSQIFDIQPFTDAVDIMVRFMADIRSETGMELHELNLGGGFGVRYVESDPVIDYTQMISLLANELEAICSAMSYPVPDIMLEPGRSIVADSGLTLYTVGSVKEIEGFRNYISVDGGMPDNPRYTLYQSQYTILSANKADMPADYTATIAGRCCESGDLLAEGINLQKVSRGDILAVLVTGAYNYSMASNYNRIPRPPVIMLNGTESYVAVERESFEYLTKLDK